MRRTTLIIFFLGLIILTGSLKNKISQNSGSEKKSSIAPWGDPRPPHQNEMLQEQTEEDEEENRYDVEEPEFLEEMEDEKFENNNGSNSKDKI